MPDVNDELMVLGDTPPPWQTAPLEEKYKTYVSNTEGGTNALTETSQNKYIHNVRAHVNPNADCQDMIQSFYSAAWDDIVGQDTDQRRHLVMQVSGGDILRLETNSQGTHSRWTCFTPADLANANHDAHTTLLAYRKLGEKIAEWEKYGGCTTVCFMYGTGKKAWALMDQIKPFLG